MTKDTSKAPRRLFTLYSKKYLVGQAELNASNAPTTLAVSLAYMGGGDHVPLDDPRAPA